MCRALVVILSALALTAAAGEGEVFGSLVVTLNAIVDARLAEFDEAKPETNAEKKEARFLKKAKKALANYTGDEGKADLKALAKALKWLVKSGSGAPGLPAALAEMPESFTGLAEYYQESAESIRDSFRNASYRKKVEKLLKKGRKPLAAALKRLETNPVKAGKLFVKAINAFRKALAKGETLRENEGDVTLGSFSATVGGETWTAEALTVEAAIGSHGRLLFVAIKATKGESADESSFKITFYTGDFDANGDFAGAGTYDLEDNGSPSFQYRARKTPGTAHNPVTGTITVDVFDVEERVLSGTFSADCREIYNGEDLTITSGKFEFTWFVVTRY